MYRARPLRLLALPSRGTGAAANTLTFTTSTAPGLSANLVMAATRRRSARISDQANMQQNLNSKSAAASSSSSSSSAQKPPHDKKRKHQTPAEDEATKPLPPSKKRVRRSDARPPVGPLPSSAKLLLSVTTDGTENENARDQPVNRVADPELSNATLLSPDTAQVVASGVVGFVSPSIPSIPSITTTTTTTTQQSLLREACDHLIRIDERMKPLIGKHHCRVFSPEGMVAIVDPFDSLASGIISQQVSGAAAKSIKKKFVALFEDQTRLGAGANKKFPAPSEVAACSIERLRMAGLSQRKAEYIKGLAEKFASGELNARMLHDAPYEEVLERLVAVRGLGRWSVEMFAVFGLKRMDIFSLGDLGVQRGCAAFVGRDVSKLKAKGGKWKYMSEKEMLELSSRFAPYRSLFMWYMWQVETTDVSVME